MDNKRISTRAIIYFEDKIVSMYREKADRIYYTFPGGGLDQGETEQQGVVREVLEEFGLNVEPIKKVYIYENPRSIEHFYICKVVGGEFGTGQGEEYQPDRNKGIYKPMLIKISDIPSLPLMPPEVAEQFVLDYNKFGAMLDDQIKTCLSK